jgi:hypothetical protein
MIPAGVVKLEVTAVQELRFDAFLVRDRLLRLPAFFLLSERPRA